MATHVGDIEIAFKEQEHAIKHEAFPGPPEKKVLPKGWQWESGRRAFGVDTVFDKDVKIPLRDNTTIYADVFRPEGSEDKPVPALLPWSPFGKTGQGILSLDLMPWRVGIPKDATSGLEKWEGPDPADWCARGYAVVNTNARGTYHSEGNTYFYGTQEGRDGYDTIEWIASQPWCNGSVAMVGNSWLGSTQWLIAAEQPPHLKAMAPWEGMGDFYRESMCRGGIPNHVFWNWLATSWSGPQKVEDTSAMLNKYPVWNEYWEDKRPKLQKINVPMYALASYSSSLHTEGSMRGYLLSSSKDKWLRIHPTQEWHDQYQPEHIEDLQKFLDRYLKGIENGWEATPRLRLSLVGYNRPNVVDRPIQQYPPENFRFTNFYLDASKQQLSTTAVDAKDSVTYDATGKGGPNCSFTYTFDKYSELCGFSKATLYMSAAEHDDIDVHVTLRKLDKDGNALQNFNIPLKDLPAGTKPEDLPQDNVFRYIGPNGRLRASHRAVVDEPGLTSEQRALMSPGYVWHPHDREEKIKPGEIVKMDVGLWIAGIIFDAGESLRLDVSCFQQTMPDIAVLSGADANYNVGKHTLHTGGETPSNLYIALSQGQ